LIIFYNVNHAVNAWARVVAEFSFTTVAIATGTKLIVTGDELNLNATGD
jgi:hypothetical protein